MEDNVTVGAFGKTINAEQLILMLKDTNILEANTIAIAWIGKDSQVYTTWLANSTLILIGLLEAVKSQLLMESQGHEEKE